MISPLRAVVDLGLKLFALGLFVTVLLNWFNPPQVRAAQQWLNRFYERFLNPIRRHARPFKLSRSAPAAINLAPLLLLLFVWLFLHPFLMWVLD